VLIDVAGHGRAAAVGGEGRLKVELSDDVVHVENVAPPPRQVGAHLQRVLTPRVGQVVEPLKGVEESQQRLVRVRAEIADVAGGKGDLRHCRRRVGDIDAGNPDALCQVRAGVDRGHFEGDAAESEAKFVQPARAEGVGVVERQTLRANQTGPRAERKSGVAVRQRRRQETVCAFETVPSEEVILLRKVIVNLAVELIVLTLEHGVIKKVVDDLPVRRFPSGDIRQRIEFLNDGFSRRIILVGWNDISDEGLSGERVVNDAAYFGEVAAAHLHGRHGRKIGLAVANPPSLIIAKEKHLVVADGPAPRAAELVLPGWRFWPPVFVVEKVVGVERVVAQEFEGAAVKSVLARFDLDVDDAAARPPELGGVGAGLDFELFERVYAGEDDDRVQPRFIVVHAVEQEVVVARPHAVGRERRRGAPGQAARAVYVCAGNPAQHAGQGARQLDEIAPVQRQVFDLRFVDRSAQVGALGLHQRHCALDSDRFGRRADLQLQVHARFLVDVELHVGERQLLETGHLGGNAVRAGRQRWRDIFAVRIADDDSRYAGLRVGEGDSDAGYRGAAPIVDRPEDRAAHGLRRSLRRPQQRKQTAEKRVNDKVRKARTDFTRHNILRWDLIKIAG